MSEHSKIQWTDDTHNFWRGCAKVSPGCKNCYAEQLVTNRLGGEWGKGAPRIRAKDFEAPLRWNKKPFICNGCGDATAQHECCSCGEAPSHRRRVFSLSLGDWLDREVPIAWRRDLLRVVWQCQNLDFLLLTKRIDWWKECLMDVIGSMTDGEGSDGEFWQWMVNWAGGEPPLNIWLGTSVENQAMADERIPILLEIPAKARFVSYEPALDQVSFFNIANLGNCLGDDMISWIIVGGESGPNARPFNVEWARSTVQQCKAAAVACFVKQMGGKPVNDGNKFKSIEHCVSHLKDPKGGDMAEWPEDLRVREWPKVTR